MRPTSTESAAPTAPAERAESTAEAPAFEQTLAELETLVRRLESGELALDEALRVFEQGVRLTRECQSALSGAQQKVQLLLQRGESAVLEEFDTAGLEPLSVTSAATTATLTSGRGADED
jgi:exodeoxyribonuclease VII small subunit